MPSLPAARWPPDDIDFWLQTLSLRAQDTKRPAIARAHAARLAAELALATGRQSSTHSPTDYIGPALAAACHPEICKQHITPVALLAGLCGKLESLEMSEFGVSVRLRDGTSLWSDWAGPLAALPTGISALVAAALAAGVGPYRAEIFTAPLSAPDKSRRRTVALLARNSKVADILPAFGLLRSEDGNRFAPGQPRPDLAMATLIALEHDYAASIRLASETRRWNAGLYLPVPLIDWPLFCLELAWRRRLPEFPLPETDDPSARFIRSLAATFE